LVDGIERLAKVARGASAEELRSRSGLPALSANFLEELAALRPDGEQASVTVAVSWSRAWLSPDQEGDRIVTLSQDAFRVAEQIAPSLRSQPESRADQFFGFVAALEGNPTEDDPRPSGAVELMVIDQDTIVRARAVLSIDDYATANRAHMSSALVTFRGSLLRQARLSVVASLTGLRLVEPAAAIPPPGPTT
jgi:hypothetical protein